MIRFSEWTPLRNLEQAVLPYLYLAGTLYPLLSTQDGLQRNVSWKGEQLWLHSGLNLKQVEQDALKTNRHRLEDHIQDASAQTLASLGKLRLQGKMNEQSYLTVKADNFEQYVLYHIVGGFFRDLQPVQKSDTSDVGELPPVSLEGLEQQLPLLSQIYPDQALLFSSQAVTLFPLMKLSSASPDVIRYGSQRLYPDQTLPLEQVISSYDERFSSLLQERIDGRMESVTRHLSKLRLAERSASSWQRSMERGMLEQRLKRRIWQERVKENVYDIYLRIPPFAMENRGEFYLYKNPVTIKTRVKLILRSGQVMPPSWVSPSNARHPFVFSSRATQGGRNICWKGGTALTNNGARLYPIRIEHLGDRRFADNVIRILREAELGLTAGYLSEVEPVTYLSGQRYRNRQVQEADISEGTRIARQESFPGRYAP